MHNIAIYEGGKASRMQGVALITTDDGNGGRVTWVPQDDRKTGTLSVSENGTYRAEDEGLHSWSKVTVRLAGAPAGLTVPTLPDPITGAEIPTGELGEIDPVAPAGLEPLDDIEPISIDEAEDILDELEIDATDPDAIEAIADYLGVDPEDLVIVDPDDASTVKEAEPKVADKGQRAEGIDQETGEETTITPSGKDTTPIPKAIAVTRPPNRTAYEDGDTIDFTGIEVRLFISYTEEGSSIDAKPYRDSRYPNGVIPFGELVFPETIASASGRKKTALSELLGRAINVHTVLSLYAKAKNSSYGQRYIYEQWITSTGEEFVVYEAPTTGIQYVTPVFVSKESGTSVTLSVRNKMEHHETLDDDSPIIDESDVMTFSSVPLNKSFTYSGKTVYYSNQGVSTTISPVVESSYSPIEDNSDLNMGAMAWTLLYGDSIGVMDVPVQWESPYDGKTLETTFEIEIAE